MNINPRPDLRPPSIIVLGKSKITPLERGLLHTFGWGLSEMDQELWTTRSKGAPSAVIEGYVTGGKPAKYLEKGPLPHDNVVVIINDDLEKTLTKRLPTWREKNWVIVTPERLEDFIETYLYVMDEMGMNLISEHGDGGK